MKKEVILISGPSGCDRDAYLREIFDRRGDTLYYSVFEYMQKASEREGKRLEEIDVDFLNKQELEKWRDEAFIEIKNKIERSDKDYHVVSTTCIFYYPDWNKEEGLNESSFVTIKPDIVIAFIDDLIEMKSRLQKNERWREFFSESDGAPLNFLAKWREDSVNLLHDLSRKHRKLRDNDEFVTNFFIFARRHPKETLASLVYERKRKVKLYLSYPITDAQDTLSKVEKFRDKLSENYIVFDPFTIKDWNIINTYDKLREDQNSMKIGDVVLHKKEVEAAMSSIRAQVVSRDFAIIDSVDAVVVYHHTKNPSAGVMAEIIYANQNGKPVFGYYPFPRPSPFFEYFMRTGKMPTLYKEEEELIHKINLWKESIISRTN